LLVALIAVVIALTVVTLGVKPQEKFNSACAAVANDTTSGGSTRTECTDSKS
jgi:Flp pilus assembly pilin Flp